MEALIKIFDNNGEQAVSARELHSFLESKRDFSNWIKTRIEKYGFIENQDFEVFNNFGENPSGGRPLIEYALTIDCAKELSMVEGNEKGKEARRYFIQCEKTLKEAVQGTSKFEIPKTYSEALRFAADKADENEKLLKENSRLQERTQFVDVVFNADELLTGSQVCKVLKLPYGNKTLYKKLRESGIYFKNKNEPLQKYVDAGYFRMKEVIIGDMIKLQTLVTQKGLGFVSKITGVIKPPIVSTKFLNQ